MEPRHSQHKNIKLNQHINESRTAFSYEGALSSDDLKALVNFLNQDENKSIIKLDLSECDIDEGIAHLAQLQYIQSLNLDGVKLKQNDILVISKLPLTALLISLDQESPELFESFTNYFANHQTLQELSLEIEKINPEQTEQLSRTLASLSLLQTLSFPGCHIEQSEVLFGCLVSHGCLRKLELGGATINGASIKKIAQLKLQVLLLEGCLLEEFYDNKLEFGSLIELFAPLCEMHSLKQIDITQIAQDEASLTHLLSYLRPLKNLTHLKCSGYNDEISEDLLSQVVQLKQLKWIDLSYGCFDDAIIFALKKLPNLAYVNLSYTELTELSLLLLKDKPIEIITENTNNHEFVIGEEILSDLLGHNGKQETDFPITKNPSGFFKCNGQNTNESLPVRQIQNLAAQFQDEILIEIGRLVEAKKLGGLLGSNSNELFLTIGRYYLNTFFKMTDNLPEYFPESYNHLREIQYNANRVLNKETGFYYFDSCGTHRQFENALRAESSVTRHDIFYACDLLVLSKAINSLLIKNEQVRNQAELIPNETIESYINQAEYHQMMINNFSSVYQQSESQVAILMRKAEDHFRYLHAKKKTFESLENCCESSDDENLIQEKNKALDEFEKAKESYRELVLNILNQRNDHFKTQLISLKVEFDNFILDSKHAVEVFEREVLSKLNQFKNEKKQNKKREVFEISDDLDDEKLADLKEIGKHTLSSVFKVSDNLKPKVKIFLRNNLDRSISELNLQELQMLDNAIETVQDDHPCFKGDFPGPYTKQCIKVYINEKNLENEKTRDDFRLKF